MQQMRVKIMWNISTHWTNSLDLLPSAHRLVEIFWWILLYLNKVYNIKRIYLNIYCFRPPWLNMFPTWWTVFGWSTAFQSTTTHQNIWLLSLSRLPIKWLARAKSTSVRVLEKYGSMTGNHIIYFWRMQMFFIAQ